MNIWRTIECGAWSRDFDYYNYVLLFRQLKEADDQAPAVSEKTYEMLCAAFDNQLEEGRE